MTQRSNPDDVLRFWFEEIAPEQQFSKDPDLDRRIAGEFHDLHLKARHCELFAWRSSPEGALAEVILLDQFSRNMFRDTPEAFACDALSLALAQEMVSRGQDTALTAAQKAFVYMPYMHSESKAIHAIALALFSQPGLEKNHRFEERHKAIIDRFGRYPHRNALLGRGSTPEELEFLKEPGSGF